MIDIKTNDVTKHFESIKHILNPNLCLTSLIEFSYYDTVLCS